MPFPWAKEMQWIPPSNRIGMMITHHNNWFSFSAGITQTVKHLANHQTAPQNTQYTKAR